MHRSMHEPSLGLVSVIVPAYNAASLIEETLQSIVGQTYPHIEIIVVDDGSTDDTVGVVQRLNAGIRVVQQPNSGGCSAPRNHGLRLAKGEFVTFFDADDLMVPTKIENQVAFLRRHPTCPAVLMDYRNFDAKGPARTSHFETCTQLLGVAEGQGAQFVLPADVATGILITENYGSACSPLIRRSVFDEIAPFDEGLRASEDFDLIYRIADRFGMGIMREVGFLRRLHDANMSWRTQHILEFKLASRRKLLEAAGGRNRELLRREVASYHLGLAEFGSTREPRLSLRHLWAAVRCGHAPDVRVAKAFVKCVFGALGQS